MLPTRDLRYFVTAAGAVAAATAFGVCPPLIGSAAAGALLANVWCGWLTIFPYDRILSAASSDGLAWMRDPGVRIDVAGRNGAHPGGTYFPFVTRLDDTAWRMYFRGSDVDRILSALSTDGVSWRVERGIRIDAGGDSPFLRVSCPRVVRTARSLRMFFTGMTLGARGFSVYSAVSDDGLSWTHEPGIRLDAADARCESIYSFCMVKRIHETESRLYFEGLSAHGSRIYLATSRDDIEWHIQGAVLQSELDEFGVRSPWVVPPVAEKRWRMYFTAGTRYRSLHQSIFSATSDNGVNWNREPGLRLRYGGRRSNHGLISPCVVAVPGGSLRVYYGGYWGWHVLAPLTRWRYSRS